jgi:hypothetical protein
MEDVGVFYGDLLHFTAICYISWPFKVLFGDLVIFFPFYQEKSGNPDFQSMAVFVHKRVRHNFFFGENFPFFVFLRC